MSNREKTLVSMAKKEEVASFIAALQKAKEDVEGAKAYARLNPVSTINNWKMYQLLSVNRYAPGARKTSMHASQCRMGLDVPGVVS